MQIEVRLKQVMERSKYPSVPKLAKQTGLSAHNIYGLIGAPNRVHLPTLAKLCEVLEVTPNDLLVLVPDSPER